MVSQGFVYEGGRRVKVKEGGLLTKAKMRKRLRKIERLK